MKITFYSHSVDEIPPKYCEYEKTVEDFMCLKFFLIFKDYRILDDDICLKYSDHLPILLEISLSALTFDNGSRNPVCNCIRDFALFLSIANRLFCASLGCIRADREDNSAV